MKYSRFTIQNFKGIKHLDFDLEDRPTSSIMTLVGLNESGKTTILEALAKFYEVFKDAEAIHEEVLHGSVPHDINDLIPKGQKANFNGDISLSATVQLNSNTVDAIMQQLRKRGFVVSEFKPIVTLETRYSFENSASAKNMKYWTVHIYGHLKGKRRNADLFAVDRNIWLNVVNMIRT